MNEYVRRLASKEFPSEAIPSVSSNIKHRIMKSAVTSEQKVQLFPVREDLRLIPISLQERAEITEFYKKEASLITGSFILPRFLRIFPIDSRFFKLATGFTAGFCLSALYISLILPSKIQSFVGMDRGYPNRKKNLGIICDAVKSLMPETNVFVNDRDDIILDQKWKISGSAARLLRLEALHHCTLLVDSDVGILNQVLTSNSDIETSATRSLRVDVKTLSDVGINDNQALETSLAKNWGKTYEENFENVEIVNPEELDEIQERVEELKRWKWIFGQTPKFTLETEDSIITCSKGKILSVRLKSGMELSAFEGVMLDNLETLATYSEIEELAKKQIILALE
ncbi:Oidioi.mRNA.OKI2018_I69.chr2.g5806.t1.cds [Oikopleura dioica]|uniref:Oidioi.mRNA.OKI2018_I69.chr2.g5806.t1.cds n=1 Tax=Oikopleura dioica TaxID=34765 RepID=A0ABN7TAI8_OIKDI|nr:Oidioi.mRNA.OKI2018_I69.chr2.g5806.t1.cds [Oikopleura dioica]